MAFDGILLFKLLPELNNLTNGRIQKIKQISKYEIVLSIRNNSNSFQLLISTATNYARIHLTSKKYDSSIPHTFVNTLRKHIMNSTIIKFDQVGTDRILKIHLKCKNTLNDIVEKILIVEIMHKHSNLVLVENDTIIEAIKRVPPYQNSYRTLLPGYRYRIPKQKQKSFLELKHITTYEDLMKYQGISPLAANEMIITNKLLHEQRVAPITTDKQFYFAPISTIKHYTSHDTISEMLDAFFYNRNNQEVLKQQAFDINILVKNKLSRLQTKLDKLKMHLKNAHNCQTLKQLGDLILINNNSISKGMHSTTLYNHLTKSNSEVILDPLKTPIENANAYYKKYKKLKRSITFVENEIKQNNDLILYFELIETQLHDASPTQLHEIRLELAERDFLRKKPKKIMIPKIQPFIIDNVKIYVGKNNKQNEQITHHIADPEDTFFHTQNIPGAHVVVKTNNLTESIVRCAANYAAYFSKAKYSSSVPVDYTKVKYVKKVKGSFDGFVIYKNHTTIYIDPTPV